MREFYTVRDTGSAGRREGPHAYERHVLQVVTLAFWGPCCVADLWVLRGGGAANAAFAFELLFREAIVFLALWGSASAAHGLIRGSRAPKGPDARQRRKLKALQDTEPHSYVAPTRGNRGQ